MAAATSIARESRRVRSIARAVLGCACLYAQVFLSSLDHAITIITAAYVVYSLIALLWKKVDEIQVSLPSLFVDTAFFIAFSAYGADSGGWIGTMLFLYLMSAAALDHEWTDICIIAGACIGFYTFVHAPNAPALRQVVIGAGLLACLFGVLKRRFQDQLLESGRREDALRDEIDKIRDHERQRIAGDFHDGPLQSFIGLQVRLDILETLFRRDPNAAMEDLRELQQIARSQVTEIRSFLRSMKPVEVDSSDLVTSVRRIVEYFRKDTGISARFVSAQSEVRLPPETGHELLQILREALHNVQKHSKASRVVVALEHAGKNVEISVDDDGTGFAFSGSFSLEELDLLRLGPQSIKRRVRSLGGDLLIESRPGHGAAVKIRVPA